MTKQEHVASVKIAQAFKAYKLRKIIQYRIDNREQFQNKKASMHRVILNSLQVADNAINQLNEMGITSQVIVEDINHSQIESIGNRSSNIRIAAYRSHDDITMAAKYFGKK